MAMTFAEYFSDEDLSHAFYRNLKIEDTGLVFGYDGELGWGGGWWYRSEWIEDVANRVPMTNKAYKHVCWNGYSKNFYGYDGENWFFIDEKKEDVYSNVELESSDEDCGSSDHITAREGFLVKLEIKDDQARFLEVPKRYEMLHYYGRSWGEGGTTGRSELFPYFETRDIQEGDNIDILFTALSKLHYKRKFHFVTEFENIMDIPTPLRSFYLKKNKHMWWNANKIAAAWIQSYLSPYTRIGKKRLDRRFKE